MRFVLAAILSLALCATALAAPKPGDPIAEVRVRGNLRVETPKILSVLKTAATKPFNPETVRQDLRAIYGMGWFADAVVEYDEEGRITFVVLERPSLRKWELAENDVVKPEDAKEKVKIETGEILKESAAESAAEQIRALYREKGYYLADVKYELVPVESGKNQVDLVFRVDPREKVRIRRIHLAGVPEDDMYGIQKNMLMGEESAWSWLTDSGAFKRAELSRDVEWIRVFYMNRGHAKVEMGEPIVQVTPDLRHIEITIPVEPGRKYNIGEITFTGDSQFGREKLFETSKIKRGELFKAETMRVAMDEIETLHADEGYAFCQVVPKPKNFTEDGLVDLEFEIRKGEVYTVGRIEATGNDYTRDRIIRREMRLSEGDKYSRTLLRKSDRNLKRLGFFKTATIAETRRPSEPVVDLNVNVEEQMTGSFSLGAGYSSAENFMFMGSISKNNVFGYGYQLRGDVSFSTVRQSYSITFNNPRLFDTDIFTGMDVYKTSTEYTEYSRESIGFRVKLGTAIAEDWHARLSYTWDQSEMFGVCTYAENQAGACDNPASVLVQEQDGLTITSSLTPSISYDSRDNYLDPLEGHLASFSTEWAGGVLGGDAEYLRFNFDTRQHFPIYDVSSLMFRARVGYITSIGDKDVPVYERFSLGGINTLRGFSNRSIGPKDEGVKDPVTGEYTRPPSGEVVGGNKQFIGNVEYVFPIFPDIKLKGVLFYDTGNSWGEKEEWFSTVLRDSAGYGIRWFSPIGPLRLEYGKNLHRRDGERDAQWEFLIGGYF